MKLNVSTTDGDTNLLELLYILNNLNADEENVLHIATSVPRSLLVLLKVICTLKFSIAQTTFITANTIKSNF